jgi:magnesium transporter
VKCSRSTEEKKWNDAETVASDSDDVVDDSNGQAPTRISSIESQRISTTSSGDSLSLGIREPVYEVRFV